MLPVPDLWIPQVHFSGKKNGASARCKILDMHENLRPAFVSDESQLRIFPVCFSAYIHFFLPIYMLSFLKRRFSCPLSSELISAYGKNRVHLPADVFLTTAVDLPLTVLLLSAPVPVKESSYSGSETVSHETS